MGERTHLSHEIKKLRSNQKQVNVKDDPVNSDDSVALASAQVQLKKVMEEKRNIENQRNKLGQEISALEDNVEVLSMENKKLEDENKRLKKTMSEQKWINVPSKQDPIGYGCGLSLEYRNYQLELELGAAQKKLKSLSALEVSAKEVEDLRRKLSSKEQYCLNLERKIAEYMKKPLQDVNCNQPQPQKIAQPVQQKSVTFPEIHKEKSHPIECNESVTGECKTQ
jgi:predicted RNase H-like nuclease (RuvC/YqgF family)